MALKSHSFKTTSAPRERRNPLYNIPELVRFQPSAPLPRQSASFPTHKSLKLRLPPWSRIPFLSRLEGGGVYYNSQASTLRYTKTLALPPSSPSSGTAVREAFIHPLISPIKTFAPHQHPTPREGWGACSREQVQPQGWRSTLPPVSPFESQLRAKMPHLRGGARPSPALGPAPPPRSQRSGPHLPRRERRRRSLSAPPSGQG